jgi:hypothetical protein
MGEVHFTSERGCEMTPILTTPTGLNLYGHAGNWILTNWSNNLIGCYGTYNRALDEICRIASMTYRQNHGARHHEIRMRNWRAQMAVKSQRPLLTGLNCLPGQQDLFTTDGGR